MTIPSISNIAFWDIDFAKLDYEKDSLFIMQKVFNYGSWKDQIEIMRYYSLPRISKEIVNARYLGNTVLSFLCVILHLQKTDFACYRKKHLNPLPWSY